MADSAANLEKMGRELKCPICLSLLRSAVSLPCNHVFCNLCIETSMKSASDCPVCKIPYRRREVRPAPHMDNLVSIYKSMEVASGVNIFLTQNASSTKLSGEDKQLEGGDVVYGTEENDIACRETPNPQNRRKFKGKGSKGSSKAQNSGSKPVRPSFPTKKRVQVPQHSPPETPIRPKKLESGIGEHSKDGLQKNLVVLKDKHVMNEKGETLFTPFFWLREEEDAEKVTQLTNDNVIDTPPDAPCFSDMKDSDDEVPCKLTPNIGPCNASHDATMFDSEMFEWTQIPCSPELCSSPTKSQIKETVEYDRILEKEYRSPSQETTRNGECRDKKRENTKNGNNEGGNKRSRKRGRKASERTQTKRAKKNIGIDSEKVAEENVQEKKCDDKGTSLNLKGKSNKGSKKLCTHTSAAEVMPENVSTSAEGPKPLNQGNIPMIADLLASLAEKEGIHGRHPTKKTGKKSGKTIKRNLTASKNSIIRSQSNEVSISQSRSESFPADGDKTVLDLCKKPRESETKSIKIPQCDKKKKSSKKVKFSTDDNRKSKSMDNIQSTHKKFTKGSPLGMVSGVRIMEDSSMEKLLPSLNGILRKCEGVTNKIKCAFCHSTEDTEASGVMVHYLKGKPVTENYDSGSNVIHAHRNCTEWAPNVYFEDENAINLEAELARSKRIKCCCCGIKGAALGCYEKTCRKSFHVPCAKLTPECRWDNENFVMLCPLHASFKLPNEIAGSQLKQIKKCAHKRQSQTNQSKVVPKHGSSTSLMGNLCGSFGKIVLCCSALTSAEKETVSEFERLSRVTLLKNWDSSVTHVIASTDENAACRRTLKFLMGILEGKWIVSIEWVKACLEAKKHVDEQPYEIAVDIHGIRDGPRLGRLRLINKQPKLFNGYDFYFSGDYVGSYKGYLHDLVVAAGGTVLHRKPISENHKDLPSTFIVYSLEVPDKCDPIKTKLIINRRKSDADALASSSGAVVATNSWILNSIAACRLQNLEK
ncbi:hypothetical protein LguiA_024943 [Lonicera macranthoides]